MEEAIFQSILNAHYCAKEGLSSEFILLYWKAGKLIYDYEVNGFSLDALSKYLEDKLDSFSMQNLKDMKKFYNTYKDEEVFVEFIKKVENEEGRDLSRIDIRSEFPKSLKQYLPSFSQIEHFDEFTN